MSPPRSRLFSLVSEARGIALLRLALVPVALLAVASNEPSTTTAGYAWVMGVLGCYGAATLALTFTAPAEPRLTAAMAVLDLVLVALLVHSSGGPASPLKFTFYVLPIGAALRLSPRLTGAWSALAVLAYLAVTLPDPATSFPGDWDLLTSDSLSLIWVSAAAVMLSILVGGRQAAISALAATRRNLVQQALDVEAAERRRLAEELHDHAIQNVLLARHELADVARGVPGAEQRARAALDQTDEQLRREVFQMHPLGLERAGLTAVLQALAETAARRGSFTVTVEVDPAVEHRGAQELLVSSARELLANAAKHAEAATVSVTVHERDGAVELCVTDDGVGIAPERLERAVSEHHIGVASVIERVHAVDGQVRITTTPGRGTRVQLTLPG